MTDTLPRSAAPAAAAPAAADEPKPKKKKLPKLVLVLVVLLGGAYVAKGMLIKPHFKHGQIAPNGQVLTLDQLTVNLSDGHLVQTTIVLQLTTVASTKTLTNDLPRFDDAAISVIGAQTYAGLLAPGGRDAMKGTLVQRFQEIAGKQFGSQEISAVYFTGFVIQ
jgi:flagellar basal body-associated protein FliL